MAYMANLLPTKILIKRNKIAGSIEIALLKLKSINNMKPESPNKTTHSLPSPKTTFEYSLKSSVCNSVIVLKVSGNDKLLVIVSFAEDNTNSLINTIILEKLSTAKKGPLKSINKTI